MNTMTTSTRLRSLIATAVLSALAGTFATVCAAADSTGVPTMIVKYGDLSVSNPQGAATLYGRIVAATRKVCDGFHVDSRDLGSQARLNACVHKAIADAVTKVGQPELFAIYHAKNGTQLQTALVSQNR
jgi:UrcA family protein